MKSKTNKYRVNPDGPNVTMGDLVAMAGSVVDLDAAAAKLHAKHISPVSATATDVAPEPSSDELTARAAAVVAELDDAEDDSDYGLTDAEIDAIEIAADGGEITGQTKAALTRAFKKIDDRED